MRPGALSIKREYFTSVLISDSETQDADADYVVLTLSVFATRGGAEIGWRYKSVIERYVVLDTAR